MTTCESPLTFDTVPYMKVTLLTIVVQTGKIGLSTSIILSLVLEDKFHEKASKIWNQKNDIVCSILTSIEATIVLRRFYKSNKNKLSSNWLSKNKKN